MVLHLQTWIYTGTCSLQQTVSRADNHWRIVAVAMSGVDAPVDEIKPPPKVLAMIEKTAKFVVKNGPKFEERIKKQNATKSIAE